MSVMVGLLEVVARLEVLSEEERRRASREEWKRVEEAGWEVVRRAEGVEVKKEKKERRRRRGGRRGRGRGRRGRSEDWLEEEEEEVRMGWWKCRGPCGRELEMNGDNFHRNPNKKTGFVSKCKACKKEKVVVPKGFKVCNGGCGKVLEENGDNFHVTAKRPGRDFRRSVSHVPRRALAERMFPMATSDAQVQMWTDSEVERGELCSQHESAFWVSTHVQIVLEW